MAMASRGPFERWLYPTAQGLYCEPGRFFIDPVRPVERAVISHAHADHARGGHGSVLATPETVALMKARLGPRSAQTFNAHPCGVPLDVGDVRLTLHPAGHILGSAQVAIEYAGARSVVSGDYKRQADPTTAPFELVRCDLFVTEATFGLPVFRHGASEREIGRLLASLEAFPERAHLIGVYSLGKCQRVIALLRAAGYERTIYLHAALKNMCDVYSTLGVDLGSLAVVGDRDRRAIAGEIVLAPPGELGGRWSRRLGDPVTALASGWMRVRARARQHGVELPLVISDHADWSELVQTIAETGAEEIWVTHGREEGLVRQIELMGRRGRALALLGREEEAE